MRALVAEMHGREWDVPPLPSQGLNMNPVLQGLKYIQAAVDEKEKEEAGEAQPKPYIDIGGLGIAKLGAWHCWERYWKGADRKICLLPKEAFAHLVGGVKAELEKEGKVSASVTSGDVLVAWVHKVRLFNLNSNSS